MKRFAKGEYVVPVRASSGRCCAVCTSNTGAFDHSTSGVPGDWSAAATDVE
jgi:hypothetical protein